MDQKQKEISGFRFNIFDFLIILGILVCLTAVITRWIMIKNAKEETVYTDIYFEVEGISEATAHALCMPDEAIYLQSNDVNIGVFSTVEEKQLRVLTEDEDGRLIEALHPDKRRRSRAFGMRTVFWWTEHILQRLDRRLIFIRNMLLVRLRSLPSRKNHKFCKNFRYLHVFCKKLLILF